MKFYDVTQTISSDMEMYPGYAEPQITPAQLMSEGAACNSLAINFTVHIGTHIDTPKHMYDKGITTDKVDLTLYMGNAVVYEIPNTQEIGEEIINKIDFKSGDIVILKASGKDVKHAYLSVPGAKALKERGCKSVGIDSCSIDPVGSLDFPTHVYLCENGMGIIEGLVLDEVPAGEYELIALPLKIKGCEGSPVRAVLREK